MVSSYKQVKLAGSLWAKGTCDSTDRDSNLAVGPFSSVGLSRRSSLSTCLCSLCFRKELKDPDQLYSTLKTILQHVKVRGRSHIDMQRAPVTHKRALFSPDGSLCVSESPERLAVHGASEENRGTWVLPSDSLPHGYVCRTPGGEDIKQNTSSNKKT